MTDDGAALVSEFAGIPTTEIADAHVGECRTQAMVGMQHRSGSEEISGTAFTVHTLAGDLDAVIDGIDAVSTGQVLVVDSGGRPDAAIFGDIMAEICAAKGVAGVIVDGAVRDIGDIRAIGLSVYSRHVYPGSCPRTGQGSSGVAARCGGVTVNTGDIIRADSSGIVVVPKQSADEILTQALKVGSMEKRLRAHLADDPEASLRAALDLASDDNR